MTRPSEQRLEISTKRDEFRADFTWVNLVFPGMFGEDLEALGSMPKPCSLEFREGSS